MIPNQVVFSQGHEVYRQDGSASKMVRVLGIGASLPTGMFARYTVSTFPTGQVVVNGTLQARAAGGRRHFSERDETAAQARLLSWATRVLRERAQEAS